MKLLFIAPSAYLLGGVQDWLATLVPGLRTRGVAVTVAVPDGDLHRFDPYHLTYPDLKAISFRNATGSRIGRIQTLVHLLEENPSDVIVGVNLVDLFPAVREARRARSMRGTPPFREKVVMTLHAIEADYLADLERERDVIDAVIATNRLSCALAEQVSGMPAERVLYAPYGVEIPEPLPLRPPPTSHLRLAWVGRLEEAQKRVHDLPAILRNLDAGGLSYSLSIAGDGPEFDRLHIDLAPWIHTGRVQMLGRLTRDQLRRQVYATHHALLITSRWETGPIVAWEAMAGGMAVVSSTYVGSVMEAALVDGETALLFPVGESGTAARQIHRLLNPALLARLTSAGRRLVRERYSSEASLRSWLEGFERVRGLPSLPLPPAAPPLAPAGRLDRWLGAAPADRIRRRLGLRFVHETAGGEWPHTNHHSSAHNGRLLEQAAAIEAHEEPPA